MFIEHGKAPRQDVAIANEIFQYMLETMSIKLLA
ncbi:penicillin-binding protein [Wolbachia endosymbiont of Drosophila ananassae]|nr:penicillin-binding protein [Wolbachia endosymbiont of Drosophila ananassae]